MKKVCLLFASAASVFVQGQTLPPTAQALYNEFYNADVTRGQYAVNNGAQAFATADGNTFYLKWVPAGATASATPLLVSLHGSSGNAFNEFYLWHQQAQAKGVGIIALQWYRGAASVSPNDYFDDPAIYSYVDTALRRIKYPSNRAFLHGFSRGSARSYAIAFYDGQSSGKNYFCTVLSNSGKADSLYPLYAQINSGNYGHALYTGKKWAMFCGGQDPQPSQSGCQAMANAKSWVQANGGNVGLYISDPNLGHGGFHQTPAYIDSSLNYYLSCYAAPTALRTQPNFKTTCVFPNPAGNVLNVNTGNTALSSEIRIMDVAGVMRLTLNIGAGANSIDISCLPPGLYAVMVGEEKFRIMKE